MKHAVIVFGEVLADIFPDQSMLGGAPFNVARHLQAFGVQPLLITRTGNDALRQRFMHKLQEYGMATSGFQLDAVHPTGQVNVVMEAQGHRFEIADNQAYDHIEGDAALAAIATLEERPQVTYFGTLAQRHAVSRHALQVLLEESSGKRFLDINLRAPWYDEAIIRVSLQHADIVKMNDEELPIVAGLLQLPDMDPEAQAKALVERFQLETVIVTAGADGAWQVDGEGQRLQAEALNTGLDIVDTVGAGDAFAAVYLLGMTQGWRADVSLSRANSFAAAICQARGGVPEHDVYTPFLSAWTLNILPT